MKWQLLDLILILFSKCAHTLTQTLANIQLNILAVYDNVYINATPISYSSLATKPCVDSLTEY